MNQNEQMREAWDFALELAAQTIELYDDATMRHDYMLDSSECAGIIRALKLMQPQALAAEPAPAQPVQSAGAVNEQMLELLKWVDKYVHCAVGESIKSAIRAAEAAKGGAA